MEGGEIAATAGLSGWIAGMATASVLGIPAGALVAALVAAALNNTADQADPGRSIPARLGAVLFDALIGGWLAMLLIRLPAFRGYGVEELGVTVAAALLTLCVPWVRVHAPATAGQVRDIAVDWLRRKFGGP